MNDEKKSKLVPAICTQCGGEVEVDPSKEMATCKYCGTSFFVEKAISNYSLQNAHIENVESVNIHKRGAVESVLSFVEKQQDKKQQKIDEEKRRVEEEKRKQEEQRKKILGAIALVFGAIFAFLTDKKNWKRNYAIIGVSVIAIVIFSVTRPTPIPVDHTGEAKTPSGSIIHEGDDYKEVIKRFEEKGFVNIKTEKMDDLVTGWLTKDGEVEKVSVDGDVDYSPDVWYPNDVEVLITYHTFPEKSNTSAKETLSEDEKESQKEIQEMQSSNVQEDVSESDLTDIVVENQGITLTVDNSEEFANFMNVKSEVDPLIEEFVSKNIGNTIVFEGNIAHMMNHGNYDTRYDILIYAGDYSETTASGPIFKFEDVNVFDLNLSGENIPDTIDMGMNIIITAEIEEYKEQTGITFLKPVKTEVR